MEYKVLERGPALRTLAAGIIAVLVFSPIVTAMIGGSAGSWRGADCSRMRAAGAGPSWPRPGVRAKLARSVRLAMEDGGVTFVKLGQVLSTRRDLLPAEFTAELSLRPDIR